MLQKKRSKYAEPGSFRYFEMKVKKGHTAFDEDIRYISKSPIQLTEKMRNLKRQHKQGEVYNIIDLPKLPFGRHQSYNEVKEIEFKDKHFHNNRNESDQKAYRLMLKQLKSVSPKKLVQYQGKNSKRITGAMDNLDIYNTRGGKLFCQKVQKVTRMYDMSKLLYVDSATYKTVQKSQGPSPESRENRRKVRNVTARLYQIPTRPESALSLAISVRYSPLLSAEPSPRLRNRQECNIVI